SSELPIVIKKEKSEGRGIDGEGVKSEGDEPAGLAAIQGDLIHKTRRCLLSRLERASTRPIWESHQRHTSPRCLSPSGASMQAVRCGVVARGCLRALAGLPQARSQVVWAGEEPWREEKSWPASCVRTAARVSQFFWR